MIATLILFVIAIWLEKMILFLAFNNQNAYISKSIDNNNPDLATTMLTMRTIIIAIYLIVSNSN